MANISVPSLWPTVPRRRRRFWNYPRPYRTGWRAWVPSWRVVVGTLLTGLSLGVGVIYAGYTAYSIPEQGADVGSQTTTVYYADGSVMGEFAALDRVNVDPAQMPNWDLITGALVASEDQTFWTNSGVDPMGIVRAFLNNVTGGAQQGGSTLTQQYIEAYYGSGPTYKDKLREVFLAYKVTKVQEKDVIIERYLNAIYFGRKAYGIQAGAQAYFGVNAADLDYNQVAFLIGVIPLPNQWDGQADPAYNQGKVKERWERAIRNMAEQGVITAEQKAAAVFPEPVALQPSNSLQGPAGYLMEMVKSEVADRAGIAEDDLMTQGYKITTTIDPAMMAAAQSAMTLPEGVSPYLRASLTSIDPSTGAIKALYGGPDYVNYPTNAATVSIAQAGSTFKPFTLIAALNEKVSIREQFDGNDDIVVPGWTDTPGGPDRAVTNFGDYDYGRIDLIKATANSVNTVYAALNVEIGPEKTRQVAVDAGIPEGTPGLNDLPSNVLGAASVHNIDLAHAYSTIAAQGVEHTPYMVQQVTSLKDEPKYTVEVVGNTRFAPDVMAGTTYALSQVVEQGSGEPAKALGRPAAGKTGTSSGNISAWFAGFVPQLTTVVGLYQYNTDTNKEENITPFGGYEAITGGSWPVRAWTTYMQTVLANTEVQQFPEYTPPKASPSPSPSPTITGVQVPTDLVGKDYQEVSRLLAELGLASNPEPVASEERKSTVIEVPLAGQTVPQGSTIAVKVSTGESAQSSQTSVPTVKGESQNQAQRKLELANLVFVNGGQEPSDTIPLGMVVRTDPPEGTTLDEGTQVTVYFSSGPAIISDPTASPTPTPTPTTGNGGGGGGNG